MITLAPLRYRNVIDPKNGPVAKVETFTMPVLDGRLFHANAFLRPELKRLSRNFNVYGSADGSGAHESAVVARHMAISEALERWAHAEVFKSPERAKYGFDVDPSSNGMAAFPGLGTSRARRSAWMEAIERFCLIGWWQGSVGSTRRVSPWNGVHAIEFLHEFRNASVVLLIQEVEPDLIVYGHAAGETFEVACNRAVVELARCEHVIRRFRSLHTGPIESHFASVPDVFERRCLFFSTPAGFRSVLARVRQTPREVARPEVVFEGEIPGPWDRFTTVWRVAIKPVTLEFLQRRDDWFFW
jgi:hypothetical protein